MGKKVNTAVDVSRRKAMFAEVVGLSNPDLRGFLFMVLFLATLGWLSDTVLTFLQAMIGNMPWKKWSYYAVGICPFFVVSAWGWWRWRAARAKKVRLEATARDVKPHAGQIIFLSLIRNPDQLRMLEAGDASVLDEERFPWKMCQLGMEKHRSRLRKVWVIPSPDSSVQFPLFVELFTQLFPGVEFIQADGDAGVDFENMTSMISAIEDILHNLPHNMDESDVIIDITGGQKTSSVAGALVTLADSGRRFQYVQTNEPYAVKSYAYEVSAIGRRIKPL